MKGNTKIKTIGLCFGVRSKLMSEENLKNDHLTCVAVITPPLPLDGGKARTAIQVDAVNLIEMG